MRRLSLVAFLLILFVGAAAIAASATTITASATFAGGYPQNITSTPDAFTVNFGTQFTSISSVAFTSTFSGNLLDPGEAWMIQEIGGQQNLYSFPLSSTFLLANLNDQFVVANLQSLLNGGTFHYYGTNGTMTLSDLTVTITGETASAVPEPASLLLLGTALLGLVGLRKKLR